MSINKLKQIQKDRENAKNQRDKFTKLYNESSDKIKKNHYFNKMYYYTKLSLELENSILGISKSSPENSPIDIDPINLNNYNS